MPRPAALDRRQTNSVSRFRQHAGKAGFDVAEAIPEYYGTGEKLPLFDAPGVNTFLGTDGNDDWDIDVSGRKWGIADQGGDDTYTIDADVANPGILVISHN